MKRTCSIRLFWAGILCAAALGLGLGFFAGTQKNWQGYEKRIARLEQEKKDVEQEPAEVKKETPVRESLNMVEPYPYILLEEDGFVTVYHTDRKTRYASTDIQMDRLPKELQEEIRKGKYMDSEESLYSFLENYTS